MIDDQTVGFRAVTKTAIMVGAASGAVLNAEYVIMVMDHLMHQCGANFFNGPCQSPRTDVDLMGSAFLGDPGIFPEREVAIGFGSALDGENRS